MKLDKSTLPGIPIVKPTYAGDDVSVGIMHFGVGGFHRAHQAMYVDGLLEKGLASESGICGVGVLPGDRKIADALGAQDGRFTLLENPEGTRGARVIGSIVDYRSADDPEVTATVRDEFGVDDAWRVVAEPSTSWVLEDVGVLLVDDVTPYEPMKLRLLNASHQTLCYFGYLAGYRLVRDTAGDPLFAELLRRYMDSEATPTLRPVPGIDLPDYKRTLIERFAHPAVRDTIARLCYGSSDWIPERPLPVVRENLRTGAPIRLSAAVVASWARYAEGVDEQGEPIDVQDQLAEEVIPLARAQRDSPTSFIENRSVFGDLVDDKRFVHDLVAALESLHRDGARATLEALVGKP